MDLRILSAGEPREAVVDAGGPVPFSVSWIPPHLAGVCLWLGIEDLDSGVSGGYVEIRVAPMSGEIAGISVVKFPRISSRGFSLDPDGLPTSSFRTAANPTTGIRVDRTAWEPGERDIPQRAVVLARHKIEQHRQNDRVYLSFSDTNPEKRITYDPLEFMVDKDDTLLGIAISANLISRE